MIFDQSTINKCANNIINNNMKLQRKIYNKSFYYIYKNFLLYNKIHKNELAEKTYISNTSQQKLKKLYQINLNVYEQIKNDQNIKLKYNELMNNKIITKEIFDYINHFSQISGYSINDIIKKIHEHNQDIIKGILIQNKNIIMNSNNKIEQKQNYKNIQREEEYIFNRNNRIKGNIKHINCEKIFIEVLRKSRIDINQTILLMNYSNFLNQLQFFTNTNIINYINIFKKITMLNNHEKIKLSDEEVKMLAEQITNE